MTSGERRKPLPTVTRWLLAFQVCNAANFTIAMGVPLVLLAKSLGAGETKIGFLAALGQLLIVLQIFAAPQVEKHGSRSLMLYGWGLRSVALVVVAVLPLLAGVVSPGVLLGVLAGCIIFFAGVRGYAGGAWLPWLNQLLPENQRGQFFGVEQRTINLSALVTLLVCGLVLGEDPAPWQYTVLYVFAFGVGMLSVRLLSNVPPMPPAPVERAWKWSEVHHRARRIWRHPGFRHATLYCVVYQLALAGVPIFLVLYLGEEGGYSEGAITKLQSLATLGVFLTAATWGHLSDRVGSRPMLHLAGIGLVAVIAFWLLCALGVFPPLWPILAVVYLAWGVFTSMQFVPLMRLVLATCPRRQIALGTALFQVGLALSSGAAPILWGAVLESLRNREDTAIADAFSPSFALFFGVTVLLLLGAQAMLRLVPERRAQPVRAVVAGLYEWPARWVSGWVIRVRGRRGD